MSVEKEAAPRDATVGRRGFLKLGSAAAVAGGLTACGGAAVKPRTVTIEIPSLPVMSGSNSSIELRLPNLRYVPVEQPVSSVMGAPVSVAMAKWEDGPGDERFGLYSLVQTMRRTNGTLARELVLSTGVYLPDGRPDLHRDRLKALRSSLGLPNHPAPVNSQVGGDLQLSPKSIAEQIVFLHPEIMVADEQLAAVVLQHINMATGFMELVSVIRNRPQSSANPWCRNVTLLDDDTGEVIVDDSGMEAVECRVSDEVMDYARPVILDVLRTIKADPDLQDKLWNVAASDDGVTINSGAVRSSLGASSSYKVVSSITERVAGFEFSVNTENSSDRQLRIKLENSFLRWASVYLEFTYPSGKTLETRFTTFKDAVVRGRQIPEILQKELEGSGLLGKTYDEMNFGVERAIRSHFVTMLPPTSTFMAVPTWPGVIEMLVSLPASASGCRLKIGTAGNSYSDYSNDANIERSAQETIWGILATVVCNYVGPTISLTMGGGALTQRAMKTLLRDLMTDPTVLMKTGSALFVSAGLITEIKSGTNTLQYQMKADAFLRTWGSFLQLLLDRVGKWLIRKGGLTLITAAAADQACAAIPFVGWAMRAVSVASNVAQIAQTTYTWATASGYVVNEIVVAIDLKITVNPDLEDFSIPSEAKAYRVYVQTSSKAEAIPFYKTNWLSLTNRDSLVIDLSSIPSGTTACIIIEFQDSVDGRGALVAKGYVGRYNLTSTALDGLTKDLEGFNSIPADIARKIAALKDKSYADTPSLLTALATVLTREELFKYRRSIVGHLRSTDISLVLSSSGETYLALECTIENLPVPLTASTKYQHERILEYQSASSKYGWLTTNTPPQPQALSCGGNSVCELGNITFGQLNGSLGYSWRSSSAALLSCTTSTANTQLFTVQNIYAGDDPNKSLRTLTRNGVVCGFASGATLVYELMGPPDGAGRNYLLDGRTGEIHVRRINNATADGLTVEKLGKSYGKLVQQPTSAILHPAGYLVAIHAELHKLEVLKLSDVPYDDAEAPQAQLFAGLGQREGLMRTPKCVAITTTGSILILEAGFNRVQGFDLLGNPVAMFVDSKGATSTSFPLVNRGAGVTYLDMGVEITGYVYVLCQVGEGLRSQDFYLDIFDPKGQFLSTTQGFTAGRMVVDRWRKVYTLNRQTLVGPRGRLEPTVSSWIAPRPKA